MPDIKVYIREENLAKWKAIPKKSDWINTLLANSDNTSHNEIKRDTPAKELITVLSEKPKRAKRDILQDISSLERERDEELEFVQDTQEVVRIGKGYGDRIKALWAEYNEQ